MTDQDHNGSGLQDLLVWPGGRLDFSAGALVMGILNCTPDSFSDGGLYVRTERAIEHGLRMVSDGAAIVDVGAESTRPGAQPVETAEQVRRVVTVIKALARQVAVPISIDTCNPEVARAALDAGARIINDITALADDRMAALAAEREVPVVLMHMQGTPSDMQGNPRYGDVVGEVLAFLLDRADRAGQACIPRGRVWIDPGIGFGKTLGHNLALLRGLDRFVVTGHRVLVGPSRKRFIGQVTGKDRPEDRVFGTASVVAHCVSAGASMVRVHDVAAMVDVVRMATAIQRSG